MKKKAQNLIEFALLACFVAIIAYAGFTVYNNNFDKDGKLVKMSEVRLKGVDITKQSPETAGQLASSKRDDKLRHTLSVETAGALGTLSDQQLEALSNITYQDLADIVSKKDANNQDMVDYANTLIEKYDSLSKSYDNIVKTSITNDSLDTLIAIYNKVGGTTDAKEEGTDEYKFIQRFSELIESAVSSS